ncbi:MAG: hypothetical protein DVB26_06865 [Verrucomicrobia bacterium]|nr:MAG: hypothetical protein DVB26_06865 [Verrucomicrobiota bacterium]
MKDELMIEAKQRAAERRSNVSAIVNEALMTAFRSAPNAGSSMPLQMPTFRPASGLSVQTSPEEIGEFLVAEDFAPYQS